MQDMQKATVIILLSPPGSGEKVDLDDPSLHQFTAFDHVTVIGCIKSNHIIDVLCGNLSEHNCLPHGISGLCLLSNLQSKNPH